MSDQNNKVNPDQEKIMALVYGELQKSLEDIKKGKKPSMSKIIKKIKAEVDVLSQKKDDQEPISQKDLDNWSKDLLEKISTKK